MIKPDKRKAIYLLHEEGMSGRNLSDRLGVSRNTVDDIVDQKGEMPNSIRKDAIILDSELLTRLYKECDGRDQRIHEKLNEEEGIKIGYSTLTRKIREHGLGKPKNERCDRVPDEPGEMQHDTSPYKLKIGNYIVNIVASILYFRYSKIRYLKFYRHFNRFNMKCFLHEAFMFWQYVGSTIIIDNTNLARLRGTGKNAIIVPEMVKFAARYGPEFKCHAIGHANRKAGNEKSFHFVETNFFPGRKFETMKDLNKQGLEWATVRLPNRPVSKSGLIPAKAFEYEKSFLTKVPPFVEAPYLNYTRLIDQYGYIPVGANFYWVPGIKRHEVTVLEYSDSIKIYLKRDLLTQYPLPSEGAKNKLFSPEGMPKPKYQPNNRKKSSEQEEKKLRALSEEINDYLDFILNLKGIQKHRFIRALFGLHKKLVLSIFIKTIKRSLKYRIANIETIERIAILQMRDGDYEMPLVETDNEFKNRKSYIEGSVCDDVDLLKYDKLLEEEDNG